MSKFQAPSFIQKRTFTKEHREKISLALKGRKLPEETKKKMSDSRIGNKHPFYGKEHTEETKLKISNTKSKQGLIGEKSKNWKGENAGIKPKHQWIVKINGKAKLHKCECGKQAMDWSNIDHKYKRKEEDYTPRCRRCHRQFDIKNNNYKNYDK